MFLVQKHFVSATNVSQFAHPKKHHGQQCVRNNVSTFTRALKRGTHPEPTGTCRNHMEPNRKHPEPHGTCPEPPEP